jgi:dTDP-4-dehydrorhamnose 3,5-epimerase
VILRETEIAGVHVVEPERHEDVRGFFARTWDAETFGAAGLADAVVQTSVSFNRLRGTLRGMHYQADPHAETKLVRCSAGAVFDVAVDLRQGSPTFSRWVGAHLSAENGLALYIPEGCAHGFLTLADSTEVTYQMSAPHVPEAARGVRYDDPAFAIEWPEDVAVITERDRTYPDFTRSEVAP